ncbi:uncharacterized protein LOC120623524 [Pararge aegeria]|uniref:uncharacterized protein LOC120623524 n=1 Tax=Pararge aegeria TaxID=116150 RepID=UPI0019D2C97D|nr:uncharacterized protein LOC120623524 [Pararge aegeria]
MNNVFLFLTVIALGSAKGNYDTPNQKDRQFNSNAIIRQLFEMLKFFIKNGSPEKDLPVLDPSHLNYLEVEFSSPANILSLHAAFANVVLSGLGDYQLLRTEFIREEIASELCLSFPDIVFKAGHYEMQGGFYESVPITGMGRFEFDIRNLTFCGKTFLRQSDDEKSILIKKITNPSFSIDRIKSQIEFDGTIDDIVNAMINELLADYLTRFNRLIAKNYVDTVIVKLNPFLNRFESMRLLLTLVLCGIVAAAPNSEKRDLIVDESPQDFTVQNRNVLVNILIRQFFTFLRNVINNGFDILNIPPLDPLKLDHFHLVVPAGLINLDLELKDALVAGIGGFVVHKSDLQLSDLSFDIDISVPRLDISTDQYDLAGDILTAIPIYGNGKAEFVVEGFRFKAKLFLKQSDDEKSVIIDRIEGATFDLPSLKSNICGVIGGGDIDAIVNAIVEEVLVDYAIRFRGAISKLAVRAVIAVGNPILEQLDTWRFIEPLLPS